MNKSIIAAVAAVLLLVALPVTAGAQAAQATNAQRALQWLQCTQQQPNGQIGSGGNPIARSAEVALGLAAAGQNASAFRHGAASLADYLTTATSTDVGTNGELLLARASQPNAGPTAAIVAQLKLANSGGEYGADLYSDALAILGLSAAGETIPADAITFLRDHQAKDGGWSFDNAGQFGSDSNTTALVLQALISAGIASDDKTIVNGFGYLASVFNTGGFGDTVGLAPDPNSTELSIAALVSGHLQANRDWSAKLDQAMNYLAGKQLSSGADAGAINGQFSKLFATTFAPNAFLLRPLTSAGIAATRIGLLACPVAATSATATPQPSAVRLPQTGSARQPSRPPLAAGLLLTGLLLTGLAGAVVRWTRRGR